jgi:ribosomal protein S24E
MKQTAVEWLAETLRFANKELYAEIYLDIEQAKDIEKHQILNTYIEASPKRGDILKEASERYYNETFNTKEK